MQQAGFQRPGLSNPVTVPSDPLVNPNRGPCGNHAQVVRDIYTLRERKWRPLFSNHGARLGAIERSEMPTLLVIQKRPVIVTILSEGLRCLVNAHPEGPLPSDPLCNRTAVVRPMRASLPSFSNRICSKCQSIYHTNMLISPEPSKRGYYLQILPSETIPNKSREPADTDGPKHVQMGRNKINTGQKTVCETESDALRDEQEERLTRRSFERGQQSRAEVLCYC
jgi:hypothetical protein